MKNKKLTRKQSVLMGALSICMIILLVLIFSIINYEFNYKKTLSDDGLVLLNSYEFPWYLTENNSTCLRPYDVGDGVITFGPGITYDKEIDGINTINKMFNEKYTIQDNCIDVEYLFALQEEVLVTYEKDVSKFAFKHRLHLNQSQFDGLVILDYNSPNFLKDQNVISMLKSNPTKNDYINAINSYYQTLNSYYDNINTEDKNDGYGVGWYNRIVDSAEVYFGEDYDFQNNRIDSFNQIK